MSKHAIPDLPATISASDLLFGSDADFVFNAYLALQRQWPDEGGFAHYKYLLHMQPGARAAVLREIAASDRAKQIGSRFVDDLPAEHVYSPDLHDENRFRDISTALRVGQTINDVNRLGESLSSMTLDGLACAVDAIVQAQQVNQACLESQLGSMRNEVNALQARTALPSPEGAAANEPVWLQHEWQRLAQAQAAQALEIKETQEVLAAVRTDLRSLQQSIDDLRHYANVELKRQMADYVTAFSAATRKAAEVLPSVEIAPSATPVLSPASNVSTPVRRHA